jgi:cystathionine beta-lyase
VSVLFRNRGRDALAAMLDGFSHFRIGASWGSSHSLVSLAEPSPGRTHGGWRTGEYVVRFHIGLEPMEALLEDLRTGLRRLEHFG